MHKLAFFKIFLSSSAEYIYILIYMYIKFKKLSLIVYKFIIVNYMYLSSSEESSYWLN